MIPREVLDTYSMLLREKKVWGCTTTVAKRDAFSVHYLQIEPGTYCSIHWHDHRVNAFYVIRGELTLHLYDAHGANEQQLHLHAGDYVEVPSGLVHQFSSAIGAEALEIYFVEPPDENDITRLVEGGRLP